MFTIHKTNADITHPGDQYVQAFHKPVPFAQNSKRYTVADPVSIFLPENTRHLDRSTSEINYMFWKKAWLYNADDPMNK